MFLDWLERRIDTFAPFDDGRMPPKTVMGFAGFYLREDGTPVIRLVDGAKRGEVQRYLAQELAAARRGRRADAPQQPVFVPAAHDFAQLKDWAEQLTPLMQSRGDVYLVDVDEDAATRIVLVDNRSNDLAGYDDELQLALLESLPDLAGTGYLDEDRDGLRELLTEHDWEHLVDQDVLDAADEDTWPEVRCKLAPELHSLFLTVPGVEDGARVGFLVQHWSAS